MPWRRADRRMREQPQRRCDLNRLRCRLPTKLLTGESSVSHLSTISVPQRSPFFNQDDTAQSAPLGQIVGVPSLWPHPNGVLQKHETGVIRPNRAYGAVIHVVPENDSRNGLLFERRTETTGRFANLKSMAGAVSTIARRVADVIPPKVAYNSAGYGLPVNPEIRHPVDSETRHPGSGGQAVALNMAAKSPHMPSAAEHDLGHIARVLAGEKELFYELIQPYERMIYTAALSVMNNPHDAEEVARRQSLKSSLASINFALNPNSTPG